MPFNSHSHSHVSVRIRIHPTPGGMQVWSAIRFYCQLRMFRRRGLLAPRAPVLPSRAVIKVMPLHCPTLHRAYSPLGFVASESGDTPHFSAQCQGTWSKVCGFDHSAVDSLQWSQLQAQSQRQSQPRTHPQMQGHQPQATFSTTHFDLPLSLYPHTPLLTTPVTLATLEYEQATQEQQQQQHVKVQVPLARLPASADCHAAVVWVEYDLGPRKQKKQQQEEEEGEEGNFVASGGPCNSAPYWLQQLHFLPAPVKPHQKAGSISALQFCAESLFDPASAQLQTRFSIV